MLAVRINGTELGFTTPNRFRPDVAPISAGDGYYGFEFPIPDSVDKIESVSVTILANGFSLPCSTESVICPKSNRLLPPDWRASSGPFRFPSFFILGAAKSGTSSLHTYLGQHPNICMSDPKEPYYFEAEYQRGVQFYFNQYFSHWQNEPIVGESRHRNLYLPYVAERIHQFNPDAKLVAILRNPAERAVSHWWHWYSRGRDPLPLREAIIADFQRIQSGFPTDTPEQLELHARTVYEQNPSDGRYRTYVDTGYYHDQLQRYAALFGRDRLHVILFEDLVRDPCAITREVLRFLGADPAAATSFDYSIVNASLPGMRDHLDDSTLAWLVGHYRSHNRRLEELLGRRLETWDRPFA